MKRTVSPGVAENAGKTEKGDLSFDFFIILCALCVSLRLCEIRP